MDRTGRRSEIRPSRVDERCWRRLRVVVREKIDSAGNCWNLFDNASQVIEFESRRWTLVS